MSSYQSLSAPNYFKFEQLESEAAFSVLARAQDLAKQGNKIINLGIGQPDSSPPKHVVQAAIDALIAGAHHYTSAPGTLECRQAVAKYITSQYGTVVDSARIVITPGGKVIMSLALLLLGEPGAEVLLPDPGFPTYGVMTRFTGSTAQTYSLDPNKNFSLNADEVISQLNEHTRLLILNSPGNPTGGTHDPVELAKVLDAVRQYPHLYVLSDEIYARLCFDDSFQSLLTIPTIQDRLIVLDGWSKTFAMTGWRLGWSVWPESLIEHVTNLAIHIHSCVNASAQVAAIAALEGDQSSVIEMKANFDRRRKMVHEALNTIPGISCAMPTGAFYAFPDVSGLGVNGATAQHELLEQHFVATIAGTSFGQKAVGNIRLSFASSDQDLQLGLDRIAQWAKTK